MTQRKTGPNGGYMEPSPNWCMDCSGIPTLLGLGFALNGFHPEKGHILMAENFGFTQKGDGKYSILTYASPQMEFEDAKSLSDWCASEKVWFLDPHEAYTFKEDDNC